MKIAEQMGGAASAVRHDAVRKAAWRWPSLSLVLLAPSLIILFVFLVVPLAVVIADSLRPNPIVKFDGLSTRNYAYILSHRYYLGVILRSVADAAITTGVALPLGYTAAMILTGRSGRSANFVMMALTFPILAGPLVVILGWMALLTDGGPLFGPLVSWGLMAKPRLIGTDPAVITSMLHFALPFVILTLYTSLKQIPKVLNEAASGLGANPLGIFIHMTLPLSLPGVVSAAVICFSVSVSSYVSPYYIGGAAKLTLTTLISQFVLATYNSQLASAAAIILLVVMILIIALVASALGRLSRP